MKKEPIAPLETFALISFSYDSVVVPLADGLRLMECFAKAEKTETDYVDGKSKRFIGGPLSGFEMKIMSGSEYMTGKLTGAKPK